jgi:glutamate-1-semialdehyde aminotransferase
MGRMKSTQLGNFQPIILRIFQSVLTYKPAMNLKRNHIGYSHTDSDIDETLQCVEDVLKEVIKHRSGS